MLSGAAARTGNFSKNNYAKDKKKTGMGWIKTGQ